MEKDIAIIGMSSLFAGARNLDEYWTNIVQEVDCITEVPKSRWAIEDYYSPDPLTPDKSYSKVGGFIPEVNFNPMEFGLPPNIIELTDTSQLLSLITAKAALEDAGYWQNEKFSKQVRTGTGVILGVGGGQKLFGSLTARLQYPIWERVLRAYGVPESDLPVVLEQMKAAYVKWEENSFPGLLGNVVAGRITNRFDLGGTNCVVDAACAASLSAVKMAVMELQLGHVDMMITGGVDTDNSPAMYLSFSKTPAFSRNNRIRPFDEHSDGIVISEGIGMVVLKRLSDAVRDGDRIYSVIKGIGSSSDGKNKSIYAPQSAGQVIAFERAYKQAGFDVDTLGYIECHGTGTGAGDPSEVAALKLLVEGKQYKQNSIGLGSVKSQVGHAKSAAGAASLIKTSLALYNKVIPPSINVSRPNPKLELDTSPFYINSETRPWISPLHVPRRAAVSAFGFGGTNFHVVMEEYSSEHTSPYRSYSSTYTILCASDSKERLIGKLKDILTQLQSEHATEVLQDIDEQQRKAKFVVNAYNLGLVVADAKEAQSKLQAAINYLQSGGQAVFEHPKGFFYTEQDNTRDNKVAALFPGQGAQYVNMAKEMSCHFPPFRDFLHKADVLQPQDSAMPLSSAVYPIPAFSDADRSRQEDELTKTENAQPAIGAVSAGYYTLFRNAGFTPDMVAGHSFGELTALWAAGAYDQDTFLALATERGKSMKKQAGTEDSTMLAVSAGESTVREIIKDIPEVALANINAPKQVILGGPTGAIAKAAELFKANNISATVLPVSAAFHTRYVSHASEPFSNFIGNCTFSKPTAAVYSNSTGKKYPKDAEKIKKMLAEHILNPVHFMDQINEMYKDGARVFVEFGPKAILTNLVKKILSDKPHFAISVNASADGSGERQFREAYVKMALLGIPVSDPDVYKIPAMKAPKADKLNVVLSGANYISDATIKTFRDGMEKVRSLNPFKAAPATASIKEAQPKQVVSQLATVAPATQAVPDVVQDTLSRQVGAFKEILRVLQEQIAVLEGRSQPVSSGNTPPVAAQAPVIPQPNPAVAVITLPVQQTVAASAVPGSITAGTLTTALLQVVSDKTGYPTEMLEMEMDMEADLGIDSIKRVEIFGAMQEAFPTITGANPKEMAVLKTLGQIAGYLAEKTGGGHGSLVPPMAAAVSTGASAPPAINEVAAALLHIVSDKTGYPAEMLEMEMDMEADLGIDSIKRVEIFGAMQEAFPAITGADPKEMAVLKTLGQIVSYLGSKLQGSGVPVSLPSVTAAGSNNNTVADISAIATTLLQIVSDKTGYPVEMLEMGMDMEADLGIDSIKRVEIFGAMQEAFPSITGADPKEMAVLRTLGQIVDYLGAKLQGAASHIKTNVASAVHSNAGIPGPDLAAVSVALLQIVSDKTGYPAEMLEMGMDMEADLGIDSIKRVEIFGAMQEAFPTITGANPKEMALLKTLGQIVDYLASKTDNAAAARTADVPAGATGEQVFASGELAPALLRIVSDKTGYPAEMLEMGMDMEGDLGIDSIKRVEIFGAMQELFPHVTGANPKEMALLKTLGQIVDYMSAKMGSGEQTAPQLNSSVSTESILPSVESAGLATTLLQIVSDKTGYPAEMLEMDMDMEADLGIDSIKRVEIFGAMQEAFPGITGAQPKEMASLKTLGQIVAYLNDRVSGEKPGTAATAEQIEPQIDEKIRRYEARLKYLPEPDRLAIAWSAKDTILIIDNGSALTGGLIERLMEQPVSVVVLHLPEGVTKPAVTVSSPRVHNIFLPEVTDAAIAGAIAEAAAVNKGVTGVIFSSPMHQPAAGEDQLREELYVKAAFFIAKSFKRTLDGQDAVSGRTTFMCVTSLDGALGFSGNAAASLRGAYFGLIKTLSLEWPDVYCRAIDIHPEIEPNTAANLVVDELHDPNREIREVGYSLTNRQTITADMKALGSDQERSAPVTSTDVFVVTGGGKGITSKCIVKLAEVHRPKFVLIGRSELIEEPVWVANISGEKEIKKKITEQLKNEGTKPTPAEVNKLYQRIVSSRDITETLSLLKDAGSDALYYAADVRDSVQLKEVITDAAAKLGKITGIVHGAGALADKLIENKTEQDFKTVFDIKVKGLYALLEAVSGYDLKHILLFSSVAGFFGNPGQSDYALSNEVLNKAAFFLCNRYPGAKVVSYNWGPWEAGMVSAELKRQFEERNVFTIPVDLGCSMFVHELSSGAGATQVVIGSPLPTPEMRLNPTLMRYSISRKLQLEKNPFLQDHVIAGNAVLPVVNAIGWIAESCRQLYPGMKIACCVDPVVYKGIVFDKNFNEDILLELEETKKGADEITFNCMLSGSTAKGKKVNHYKATVTLKSKLDAAPLFTHKPQLSLVPGVKAEQLYGNGTLFHGPSFRGIRELVGMNDNELVIKCQIDRVPEEKQGQFPVVDINSFILDVQYQGMLFLARHLHNVGSLPVRIDKGEFFKPMRFGQDYFVYFKLKYDSGTKLVADIYTYDTEGKICASTEGAEVVLSAELNDAFLNHKLVAGA